MSEYLFVYGTLRSGLTPSQIEPLLAAIKRVGPAIVRGRLYDLGAYPGVILEEPGGCVSGELLVLDASLSLLEVLDNYEGVDDSAISKSLFLRTKCRVELPDRQVVEAWIYVYNQSLNAARLIESGDYAEVAARTLQSEMAN